MFSSIRGKVAREEPLKRHTSWQIGGPAEIFIEPADPEDLIQAIDLAKQAGLPLFILGNGTNILVSDKGVRGLVIKIGRGFDHKRIKGKRIFAGAAATLVSLARVAAANGLGGLEFAIGIPGTLGGALVMNAGANNANIGSLVNSVRVILPDGEMREKSGHELEFGYRCSKLEGSGEIVIGAILESYSRDPAAIKKDMDTYLAGRRLSQPRGYPNAGSVFKNPRGYSAGQLVEASGCKGMERGGAQVSLKHANFIVNRGNATAGDVMYLIERVREKVRDTYEIELKTEIKIWGDRL
ncbi:MAG TPA: UDP-N-acetylmuramate dehydrogenase [Clostridia bacterium]|nr:UDP-N-acetylmuramate dehydrogenase [Clostridia bacterium]